VSLLSRIQANEECAVGSCHEQRVDGTLFCGSEGRGHLADFWASRLQKLDDGTYAGIAGPQPRFAPKDLTGARA
jgi:hypothetical protein